MNDSLTFLTWLAVETEVSVKRTLLLNKWKGSWFFAFPFNQWAQSSTLPGLIEEHSVMLAASRTSRPLFMLFLWPETKLTRFNYSVFLVSKNPTSSSSAIPAQRACVLAAASVRPLSGPSASFVDVSSSQASLWPRRPEWGEKLSSAKSFFDTEFYRRCSLMQFLVLRMCC